jgi:hypothetical protein
MLKGIYWLILGLCVWFIPSIMFEIAVTSEDSEKKPEEAISEFPIEIVIVQFGAAFVIILKGVITIRKERKAAKSEDSRNKKFKKK